MPRWILHVDMDAFYASVEELDHPELRGKPVIVAGPEPRGVVATASYAARQFGVRSGMPTTQAKRLCPHGIFLPPRFDRYEEMAQKIRAILSEYTPLVEPVSLDEAFLDLSGSELLYGPPERIAEEIHMRIPKETNLSCSVGVGPNKLVAKLASDAAKPGGLKIVYPEEVQSFLDQLPVEKLWGVGPKTAARLEEKGVRTVYDLRQVPLGLLRSWFGPKGGEALWQLARGLDETPVVPVRESKSLSHEVTYAQDIFAKEKVEAELRRLALLVVDRLRAERLLAQTVQIKVRFADFTTCTRQTKLPEPTDQAMIVAAEAVGLLSRVQIPPGQGVRLLGVGVADLVPATFRPLPLFLDPKLGDVLCEVRQKFGTDALRLGNSSSK
ncbi:MAG: DNA polymerase IV [Candidatus Bipolaricaulota bacterium]|nr:DNA polymerase IV [Candidatus Bipolaricaulota bacterium]MDW8126248.1 DNA polymerase IV [Candidatus Bipolaricaulota bacterium]